MERIFRESLQAADSGVEMDLMYSVIIFIVQRFLDKSERSVCIELIYYYVSLAKK